MKRLILISLLLILAGCQKDDNPVSSFELKAPYDLSGWSEPEPDPFPDHLGRAYIFVQWEYDEEEIWKIDGFYLEEKCGDDGSHDWLVMFVDRQYTSKIFGGTLRGMSYYYRIRAFKGDNYSPYSREIRVWVDPGP